eukprot:754695-Hanusia_phi.AAC.1
MSRNIFEKYKTELKVVDRRGVDGCKIDTERGSRCSKCLFVPLARGSTPLTLPLQGPMASRAAPGDKSNRSFRAGAGAQFIFNFNFIQGGEQPTGSSSAISLNTTSQNASTQGQGQGPTARSGPVFCFNFNIPSGSVPPEFMRFSNVGESAGSDTKTATGQAAPTEKPKTTVKQADKENEKPAVKTEVKTEVKSQPAAPAPAAQPASSARPWETTGIKPVETPGWAKAAQVVLGNRKLLVLRRPP